MPNILPTLGLACAAQCQLFACVARWAKDVGMGQRVGKPLGHKSYGTIAHLPGSRQGRDDVGIGPGQAEICVGRPRDKRDRVIVQEKLDGSNVAVACVAVEDGGSEIVALIRAGYRAIDGRYEQHKLFHLWVMERVERFAFLRPGERVCGEWLAQAHGTRYALRHEPFVAFDIMRAPTLAEQREGKGRMELAHMRVGYDEFVARASGAGIALAECVFDEMGKSCTIERAMEEIDRRNAHGALDSIEGAVWRVERVSKEGAWEVDFLAKFVRHGKVDGKYLPEISGEGEVWNWRPGKGVA